jgi:hypothetical protein
MLLIGVSVFANQIHVWANEPRAARGKPTRPSIVKGFPNHSYPRVANFQWGGAVPDWYARFDLMDTGARDAGFARAIKALNPNIVILPTRDWNAGPGSYGETVPDEWKTRHANGSFVKLYFESDNYMDLTDFCPPAKSGPWAGKRYNEIVAAWHIGNIDLNVHDGIATDGLWNYPYSANGDIDLDRNGVNDFKEHGDDWISDQITKGIDRILADLRQRMGPDKAILVNSGGMHTWGWKHTNGMLKEHSVFFYSLGDVDYNLGTYLDFMKSAPQPHVVLIDGETSPGVPGHDANIPRNNFRHMRFWLGFTLLGDGYLSFSTNEEHMYTVWYDEFELDLGYPTTEAQKIRESAGGGGLWVRFFDNGVVVFNGTGAQQQVTDGDLARLPGYAGPYYHFRGGQDPAVNNGARFANETVAGETGTIHGTDGAVTGTALILLKSPKEVVSDIIIDNWHHATSPGSYQAELTGRWEGLPNNFDQSGGGHYTLRDRHFEDPTDQATLVGYATALKGNGASAALFRPTIGLAGNYEIFEWHGYLGSSESAVREATDVKYKIKHSGGEKIMIVDQSQNSGRWNSLGVYYLTTGQQAQVSFDNNADGPIMADAIKFVFRGSDPNRDITPPQPPKGLKITQ